MKNYKEMTPAELLEFYKLLASCQTVEIAHVIAAQHGLVLGQETDKNMSVKMFLETKPEIADRRADEVYKEYQNFCLENHIFPLKTQRGFTRAINDIMCFHCERIQKNNKQYSVFIDPRKPKTNYNKELSDHIYKFTQSGYFEKFAKAKDFDGQVTSFVHDIYCSWCKENNLEPISIVSFVRTLCDISDYQVKDKRVNGVPRRVFYL